MITTNREILAQREQLRKAYTFHEGNPKAIPKPQQRNPITTLTINTDVSKVLRDLEQTVVLTRPRNRVAEFHNEIIKSRLRVQRVKNGASLSTVFSDEPTVYQLQESPRVAFLDEQQALQDQQDYIVPGVPKEPEFVLPRTAKNYGFSSPSKIEFNQVTNNIYEKDRQRYNETMKEINLYNRRLSYSISQQYSDYQKYGLQEAQRRARRSERLSALKEKRTENWWPQIVKEISISGKSLCEIQFLNEFAALEAIDSDSVLNLYQKYAAKYKYTKKLQQIIRKINECHHFADNSIIDKAFKTKNVVDENKNEISSNTFQNETSLKEIKSLFSGPRSPTTLPASRSPRFSSK